MSRPTGLPSEVIAREPGLIAMKCIMCFYTRVSVESIRFSKKGIETEGKRWRQIEKVLVSFLAENDD